MARMRVLLIGDSIRMAYAPLVKKQLKDLARVVEIKENGGDSGNVRAKLDKWLRRAKASRLDLVHFNCGLHDIKRPFGSSENQQPLDKYIENLEAIIKRLRTATPARVAWATTTPVIYDRHHAKKGFDRFEEDVVRYNDAARRVMEENGIPINDLFAVIAGNDTETCLGDDGVHMTRKGNELLAAAVSGFIRRLLAAHG